MISVLLHPPPTCQVVPVVKKPSANVGEEREADLISGPGKSPGGGHGNFATPVFLPGESHGQRSLAGYTPEGSKESDMIKET